jgi:two-component system alkaline phosphatase synthesis response regulator PhoP
MKSALILFVEENNTQLKAVADTIESNGFSIKRMESPTELEQNVHQLSPDLVILPVELKQDNGIDICHGLKQSQEKSEVFVMLLSKKKEDYSMIAGLESGADDFLTYPIHERVLLGRINALLKRKKWKAGSFAMEPLVIDRDRYLIICKGKEFYLPKKEFEILSLLFSKPDKVFSRDEIKNAIWEDFEKVRNRTVDVHIRKIREKIGENLISTIKGVGYKLEAV